ncbi:MAG: ATP synthase subunit C family protein [Holosporales bacterium]|jgi:F0F1-type ATP synthase membrane subunit c/vacuolar-type H+-ATPase subunit K
MEPAAAKLLGAGIAMLGVFGVGIGLGNIFSAYITSTARNPSAEPKFKGMTFVGMAVTEAVALFALLIAIMLITL